MDINFIHHKTIKTVQILIRNDDFLQSPVNLNAENNNIWDGKGIGSLKFFMHYPRQLLRTAAIHEKFFTNSSLQLKGMRFTLKNMEVFLNEYN
jgi:hypothetical protein